MRINRELGGHFDVDSSRIAPSGRRSTPASRCISSARDGSTITVDAANCDFVIEDGESIWTESSYKYTPEQIARALEQAGFRMVEQWIDEPRRLCVDAGRDSET